MKIKQELAKKDAPEQLIEKIQDIEDLEEIAELQLEYPEYSDLLRDYQSYLYAKRKIRFPIEKYENASKTMIAQEYAKWLINKHHTVPVYVGDEYGTRLYYTYDKQKGIWKKISYKYVKRLAKYHLGNKLTRHTLQEFAIAYKNSPDSIHYDDMGLGENEILLRNRKILNLDQDKKDNIRKVEPEDYALNRINATEEYYEPDKIVDFIKQTFPKEEDRKTLQEFVGWCLKYPNNDFQKALIILGESNTGKSTFLKLLREFLKDCEISEVAVSQLGMKRRYHIGHVAKSIVNIDEDMSNATIEDGSTLKTIIQQQNIFVDPKGKNGYTIKPKSKLIVASNVSPTLADNDAEFYEKFITIEAPNVVAQEDQDRRLYEKLTTEKQLNGFLHWSLEGLRRLEKNNRFTLNSSPIENKRKWDRYGTSIQKFIEENIRVSAENNVPTTDVYQYYCLWSSKQMQDTVPRNKFISEMSDHPQIQKGRAEVDGSNRSCFMNVEVDYE